MPVPSIAAVMSNTRLTRGQPESRSRISPPGLIPGTVDIAYKGNRVTVTVHASIFIQGIGQPLNIFQSSHH